MRGSQTLAIGGEQEDIATTNHDSEAASVASETGKDPQSNAAAQADPASQAATNEGEKTGSNVGRDNSTGRFVSVAEHVAERKKLQERAENEARLRSEADARAQKYEQEIAEIKRWREDIERRARAERSPPPPMPDPLADPEAFGQYTVSQAQQISINATLNMSEMLARDKFGDQVVDQAVEAAMRANVAQQFLKTRHPYAEIVNWHKREQALAKIGPDPDAYEKMLEDRIRGKVLEELKAGQMAQGGAAPAPQKFPGTLADATQSGAPGAHLSDEAMMGGLFAHGRKRR